jgi:hypothetical protein
MDVVWSHVYFKKTTQRPAAPLVIIHTPCRHDTRVLMVLMLNHSHHCTMKRRFPTVQSSACPTLPRRATTERRDCTAALPRNLGRRGPTRTPSARRQLPTTVLLRLPSAHKMAHACRAVDLKPPKKNGNGSQQRGNLVGRGTCLGLHVASQTYALVRSNVSSAHQIKREYNIRRVRSF